MVKHVTKRFLNALLGLALLLPNANALGSGQKVPAAHILLLRSDESGILLELSTPQYEILPQEVNGQIFERLQVQGAVQSSDPGRPQLPALSALLAVPPQGEVSLHILDDRATSLNQIVRLPLAPAPAPLEEDLTPGRYTPPNPNLKDQFSSLEVAGGDYPHLPVSLGEPAWLRDQRLVRVVFYPFQVNPTAGSLTWHKRLRVELRFSQPAPDRPQTALLQPTGAVNPFEQVLAHNLLNYQSSPAWRGQPEETLNPQSRAYSQAAVPSTRYRIPIDRNGIYRLSYAALQAAGLPVESLDPTTFRLTSQGQDVAISVSNPNQPNTFNSGEYILFYGQKFRGERMAQLFPNEDDQWLSFLSQDSNGAYQFWSPQYNAAMWEKYTDQNVYWLSFGSTPGAPMDTLDGAPGAASTPDSYRATQHAEQSHAWKTTLFTSEDTWFWEKVQSDSAQPWTYTTTLSAPATGDYSATVRGEVVAEIDKNHAMQVTLNGNTLIDPATWSGKSRYHFEVQLPQSLLVNGVNSLGLVFTTHPEKMYFDWFEIEYQRQFQAQSDQITFSSDQAGTYDYQIGGITVSPADLAVLEITDPTQPRWIENVQLSSSVAEFEVDLAAGASFIAAAVQDVPGEQITPFTPPDFSTPADYVIITHPDFHTAIQALADYRAAQGLSVRIIDVDDLYNQFTEGIFNPLAVKEFLRYARDNWPQLPTYVLLVGDGHWNFKGYSGYENPPIYMPPNLAWVDYWQGEVDSANLLAAVVGNDPLPDVNIARLPVNSAQQVQNVVAKIEAYEAAPLQPWQLRSVFVADNTPDPAGDFPAMSDDVITADLPDYFTGQRLYLDDYSNNQAVTDDIVQSLNDPGALFLNYIGHASIGMWTNEQIFTVNDIQNLQNENHLPVVLSMTCLDGYWIYPNQSVVWQSGPSLAEELVRRAYVGAVATFSPTGLGVATGHDLLHHGYYQALFQDGIWKLGPATLAAKLNLYSQDTHHEYNDLLQTFTVFGDPALYILGPYNLEADADPAITSTNPGETLNVTMQIHNIGEMTDTYAISSDGSGWSVSHPNSAGPLDPGEVFTATITVQVPEEALQGERHTVALQVQSLGRPSRSAQLNLTAVIGPLKTYLPYMNR
jgi:hypothetical protein